jgi:hypothetical protein
MINETRASKQVKIDARTSQYAIDRCVRANDTGLRP